MNTRFCRYIKYALPVRPLIVLLTFTFVILLPLICWNLEHSLFFIEGDLNRAAYYKRLDNNRRLAQARTYFNDKYNKRLLPFNYKQMSSNQISTTLQPEIAFIILGANRDTHKVDDYEPKYLTQTLHSLLVSINKDVENYGKRWSDISISMCNIDNNPSKFYELKILTRYFDYFQINSADRKKYNKMCDSQFHFNSCISLALNKYKTVKKFVIIEDDLLANKNLLPGLTQIFTSLEKRFKSDITKMLGYVQLYYPNHELKFQLSDTNSLFELLMISCLLVVILYALYFRLHMRSMFFFNNILLLFILLLICGSFVYVIGRPHWLSAYHQLVSSYKLVEPTHKTAAAVLMDRQYMTDLVSLNSTYSYLDDNCKMVFMDHVANQKHRRILSVNFNLFKHIGLYSSFKKRIINPYLV